MKKWKEYIFVFAPIELKAVTCRPTDGCDFLHIFTYEKAPKTHLNQTNRICSASAP